MSYSSDCCTNHSMEGQILMMKYSWGAYRSNGDAGVESAVGSGDADTESAAGGGNADIESAAVGGDVDPKSAAFGIRVFGGFVPVAFVLALVGLFSKTSSNHALIGCGV